MTNETRSIEATDIVDFTFKIQQAILDGYRLSDVADFSPQNIGFMYITTMLKAEPVSIGSLALTVSVDTEQALAEITKIAQETGQYGMTPEQQDKAVEAVRDNISITEHTKNLVSEVDKSVGEMLNSGSMSVEPNIVAPKQTRQTRGRK